MKYQQIQGGMGVMRRSPCGERGLKSRGCKSRHDAYKSLPVRGAWVEISSEKIPALMADVAPRAGSVG